MIVSEHCDVDMYYKYMCTSVGNVSEVMNSSKV